MKKILILLALCQYIQATEIENFEGREGFKFGIGVVALGGCTQEETWDEEGKNVIDTEKSCGAVPLLDMEIGYNTSNQFGVSLDVKTLILASLVGIKAKYYLHNQKDTAFISLTGGALDVGNVHSGFIGSYNNVEWGYAYGQNEFSLGVGIAYGDSDVMVHLNYKYMF